jgi:serine/threonine-protein kinase
MRDDAELHRAVSTTPAERHHSVKPLVIGGSLHPGGASADTGVAVGAQARQTRARPGGSRPAGERPNMAERPRGAVIAGKYRLVSLLGEGSMGRVYRAEQLDATGQPLREVALKTLLPELSRDPALVRRFLREVRIAASLVSPHTVVVHESGTTENGILFYSMELVRGPTLFRILQDARALPVERAARLLAQVCEALAEAHGRAEPIVHRDLKLENVFVARNRERDWVKVGDFGIAKVLGERASRLTRADVRAGSPVCMAPEQWRGEPVDPRTDLYALGVIAYELFTGASPFPSSEGPDRLMYRHLHETPPPLPATVPAPAREVVTRLLAKDRADRPSDAVAVGLVFERIAAAGSVEERATVAPANGRRELDESAVERVAEARPAEAPVRDTAADARASFSQPDVPAALEDIPPSAPASPGLATRLRSALPSRGVSYTTGALALGLAVLLARDPLQSVTVRAFARAPRGVLVLSLNLGLDPNARDGADRTLLNLAARSGRSENVQALLEWRAFPNAIDRQAVTPLMDAAAAGDAAAVGALLAARADPNARDRAGATALMYAAAAGVRALVDRLIAGGADPRVRNLAGRTAADVALASGHPELAEALR